MNLLKNNFIKFLIIGAISTIINYGVFTIFYKLGVYYIISSSFGYISGLILGYFLNKNYNFYLRNYKNTFYKYLFIYLVNLTVSLLLLYLLVNVLHLNVYIGNFLIIIYSTLANYIGLKYYVFRNKALLSISISGNSGSGKTTLASFFLEVLGEDNTSILNGDSAHKWNRGSNNRDLLTHLNPLGNNLKKELKDLKKIINGLKIQRKFYNHKKGKHTKKENISSNTFIIYEGLHGLYGNIGKLFNLKIFIESSFDEKNKITRDIEERNRDRNDLLINIEKRKKDYDRYILPQKNEANICIKYENSEDNSFINIKIKDGIDKKLKLLLRDIPGIKVKNNKIKINKNTNYDINKELLKKYGFNFIFQFNPDLVINKSHKGVFVTILICLIQKYADNNTNVLNMKKIYR